MFDLMFPTNEILQPRPDTPDACWNCCSLPVRACSPTRIPRRHVRSIGPYPWDPEAPSWSGLPKRWDPVAPFWYLVVVYDLVFRARGIMQHPFDNSYARSIWYFEPVIPDDTSWNLVGMYDMQVPTRGSLQPDLIPSMHIRYVVPYPWDHAAPPWYLVGMYMYDLMFLTREILQPRPDTL